MGINVRLWLAINVRCVYVVVMTTHRHPHSALIDALNTNHVRIAFGLTPQHLYAWRCRGIPISRRVEFARMAAAQGVMLPRDFLDGLGLSLAEVIGRAA